MDSQIGNNRVTVKEEVLSDDMSHVTNDKQLAEFLRMSEKFWQAECAPTDMEEVDDEPIPVPSTAAMNIDIIPEESIMKREFGDENVARKVHNPKVKYHKMSGIPYVLTTHPLQCNVCGDITLNVRRLAFHMKQAHPGVKRFACPSCGYRGASNQRIENHIQSLHAKKRFYQCFNCEFFTTKKYNLKVHKVSVHEATTFVCYKCNKICDSALNLRTHDIKEHGYYRKSK